MYKFDYLLNLFINIIAVFCIPLILFLSWEDRTNDFYTKFSKGINAIISIFSIATVITLIAFEIIIFPKAIDYCKDIPAFITGNYRVEVGKISDRYVVVGGVSYEVIVVNGLELKGGVSYNEKQKYYEYKFYYLHNSRWIMDYVGYK